MTKKQKSELASRLSAFLDEAIRDPYEGVRKFDLDGDLAVCVGWISDADPADPDLIYSKEDPRYALAAGIKCRRDSDWSDYESLASPIDADGNALCCDALLTRRDDCDEMAEVAVEEYEEILGGLRDGSARLC